jgi:hypothetical protein
MQAGIQLAIYGMFDHPYPGKFFCANIANAIPIQTYGNTLGGVALLLRCESKPFLHQSCRFQQL